MPNTIELQKVRQQIEYELALIGGRIVPSFTRNWLVKQGRTHLPASFGGIDKAKAKAK